MTATNKEFDIQGIHHLALVCKDMAKTVEFYRDVLGMPLVKTLDMPGGRGQHFFFDMGNNNCLAFFWFPGAPEAVPGVAAPQALPRRGNFMSAHGSMNHVAFTVPNDKFEEYHQRLIDKGVDVTEIANHDNSATQISAEMTEEVYVRSIYFSGPDGECLEFACWTLPEEGFTKADLAHDPCQADGTKRKGLVVEHA